MRRPTLLPAALLLFLLAALVPADEPSTPVKGTTIFPDSVPLKPGGSLSVRTPVARPLALRNVRAWTVETRRHRWNCLDLALSPDGSLAATSGYDGMVRLWNAHSGQLVRVLVGHDSYVHGISFSADGRYLASAGSYDYTVRIWEVKTGLPVKVLRGLGGPPIVTAWSPDGSLVAAGTTSSGYVHVWQSATGTERKKLGLGKPVVALAFAPDGETLACGVSEVGVSLLTAPTWTAADRIDLPGESPRGLSWSADGKQLAIGSTKQLAVWDAAGKKIVGKLDEPGGTLDRRGNRLVTSGSPARLWNLDTGKIEGKLPPAQAAGWSPDGQAIYLLQGENVLRVDAASGKEAKRWSVASSGTLQWQPGRPILGGLGTRSPRLWDQATGKLLHTLEGHTAAVTTAAWSPGGKVLATGSHDRTVRVWDLTTGKALRTLTGLDTAVTALAVAGDGKIAAGTAGSKVHVFAPETVQPLRTFSGHTGAVRALAWGRDGRLASGGVDAAIHVWGQEANKPYRSFENAGSVECLAFAGNGRYLAAGASEERVWVWTYPGRKLLHEFSKGGSPPGVTSLAWSPDSLFLLAGRANHTAQLWDLRLGKERLNLACMAPVQAVAVAAGGKALATCSLDRSIRFWHPFTGRIQTTVIAESDQLAAVTAEGYYRVADEATTELVLVALTKEGMDTFSPAEFAKKFGWKNLSTRARFTGN